MPNPLGRALRNRRAGHDTLVWAKPELAGPENFTLTSPAFPHEQPMPERLRGRIRGANVSPELNWTTLPAGTAELVLIVEDPDVPGRTAAPHGLSRILDTSLTGIPESGLANPSPVPGIAHGKGRLGRRGYFGPMPIPSHGPHFYVFQLFALDEKLELGNDFGLADLTAAMAGHVVGRARLDGTFENP